MEISILIALLAGMLSFLSPCVLPLVPAYIGFISGSFSQEKQVDKKLVIFRGFVFVIGFSLVFIIMGATASFIGRLFFRYQNIFNKVSGIFIMFFGLYMLGIVRPSFLSRELRFRSPKNITSSLGSFLMGMAFAAGWSPCVGSVLGAILLYAGTTATVYRGVLLLGVYSLGLGIPFLLTTLLTNEFNKFLNRYDKAVPYISKIGGILLVLLGLLIFLDKMVVFSRYFYFIDLAL
ncbi:cytochrome c biogenesis CcdA family protein [Natronincola ferrireducens]|uniref:Cytochrome c-type biogenesis protein n=1 Tax=Natronincola ferrireducens TaxID=393762 RepID=A0A1G8ZKT1_9FIRM|nr:cytochrome c biogenesis protein CcdA [Natronincola ferrireducens]SDK14750.1 cytochrome c-type biogenesis protein [Natronincola ferrireducens]